MRLYKRGSTYWCAFYAGGERIRRSTRCTDRRAAEAVARDLERSASDSAGISRHSTTIESALGRLLADRRDRGRSAATLSYYAGKCGHLARLLGADQPLEIVDARLVDDYVAQRLSEGASRHTVAKELGTLRSALRLARRRGEFSRDPSEVLPIDWAPEYVPKTRALTLTEAWSIVDNVAPQRGAHVAFLLSTGARWGESVRAQRIDIDLAADSVRLRGTKTALAARVVPILSHVRPLANRALLGAAAEGKAYAPWGSVWRDLRVAAASVGLEPVSPNDLRRSAATWLRRAGCEPSLIAEFLGHASSAMCERVYGRLQGKELGSAIAARLNCDTFVSDDCGTGGSSGRNGRQNGS